MLVQAVSHDNGTSTPMPPFVVVASVTVRCAGEPVADAEVEVLWPDGRRTKIVTDGQGVGRSERPLATDYNGRECTFRIIVNDEELTQPATIRRHTPPVIRFP